MKTGIASFTLDWGKCPRWLFDRMVRLGRIVGSAIIEEFGSQEFLRRIADPVWFQSLGTVMAFDWNASGLTTTTLGALKAAFAGLEKQYGIFICGGKGKTSRKTPLEIQSWGMNFLDFDKVNSLVKTSRLTAKVDSALIQDGFNIYHHNFIFDKNGNWTVVQQGMNTQIMRARRYHWFSQKQNRPLTDLIEEPHTGIATQTKMQNVLDLTSIKSKQNRQKTLDIIKSSKTLYRELKVFKNFKSLSLPDMEFHTHPVLFEDFENPRIKKTFEKVAIQKPTRFDELILIGGVGPKTVRALSLVSEVIYGAKPSYEDPARYSFAYGGKDGTPFPVDRKMYDETLSVMEKALLSSKIYFKEKDRALRRLESVQKKLVNS